MKRAVGRLDKVICGIIEQRRASGQMSGDLLSAFLQTRDDEGIGMTDRQLHDEIMTLFLAGHETTANVLSWTWLLLGQNPEAEQKLIEEKVQQFLQNNEIKYVSVGKRGLPSKQRCASRCACIRRCG